MLRCPFNNFSKCDGSCPFSMPDFTSCRLATALVAIEGICKGHAAQTVTTNAHLVEVKDKLDALIDKGGTECAPQKRQFRRARHQDQPRLRLANGKTGESNVTLVLPGEYGEQASSTFGDRCGYSVTDHGEVLLFFGRERRLSPRSGNDDGTRTISMMAEAARLSAIFPNTRIVYLELVSSDGVFRLKPRGRSSDGQD